jgi:hypothetical protein
MMSQANFSGFNRQKYKNVTDKHITPIVPIALQICTKEVYLYLIIFLKLVGLISQALKLPLLKIKKSE